MKNIFVGNLDFNTSEDELRNLFGTYGQVDRVSIMTDRDTGRSRGFGFVEMASAEDGEKAIAALNGTQVGGRTLNVNEARPKVERGGGGGGGGGTRSRWTRRRTRRRWRRPKSLVEICSVLRPRRLLRPSSACKLESAGAPVAQMDRAIASGAIGREFESLRAHQFSSLFFGRVAHSTPVLA